jgi:hypothetical protein
MPKRKRILGAVVVVMGWEVEFVDEETERQHQKSFLY